MGSPNTKGHDPAKCGYSQKGTNDVKRRIEKAQQIRNFKRCRLDARYECTPENCPRVRQRVSEKRLGLCKTQAA